MDKKLLIFDDAQSIVNSGFFALWITELCELLNTVWID
jgi:hypothetical protein